MAESGGAHRKPIVSRFWSDDDLHVTRRSGHIHELLEYDANDLLGTQWRRVLCPRDADVAHRFIADLKAKRAGAYSVCNISKSGIRLYLYIQSFFLVQHGARAIGGLVRLDAVESPRAYQFNGWKSKGFLLLLQAGIYAENLGVVFL